MYTAIALALILGLSRSPGADGQSRRLRDISYPAWLVGFCPPLRHHLPARLFYQEIHVGTVARNRVRAGSPDGLAFTSPRGLPCHPISQNRVNLSRSDESTSIGCLFSDIDGTLVHYYEDEEEAPGPPAVLALPPSATGRKGRISIETLKLVSRIRSKGTRVVLVSGTRYSTFVKRLPFLPRADAYVIENGGRIFYPRVALPLDPAGVLDDPGVCSDAAATGIDNNSSPGRELESAAGDSTITGHAANALTEDTAWRARLESMTGPVSQDSLPPEERKGPLWDVYRQAVTAGFEVDTNTYFTMLRVKASSGAQGVSAMQALIASLPPGLRVVTNLGMVDICPEASGKHNAAAYLAAERLGISLARCASMGDDDNDIDLANIMGKGAFMTTFSSESVERAVKAHPARFHVAREAGVKASEEMLRLIADAC